MHCLPFGAAACCQAAVDSLAGSSDALFIDAAPFPARNLVRGEALLHGQRIEAFCKARRFPLTIIKASARHEHQVHGIKWERGEPRPSCMAFKTSHVKASYWHEEHCRMPHQSRHSIWGWQEKCPMPTMRRTQIYCCLLALGALIQHFDSTWTC